VYIHTQADIAPRDPDTHRILALRTIEILGTHEHDGIHTPAPHTSAKEPYISAKEPNKSVVIRCRYTLLYIDTHQHDGIHTPTSHISAKEPNISAKEPHISAKEPDISAKEPFISAKEPNISAKEPKISVGIRCRYSLLYIDARHLSISLGTDLGYTAIFGRCIGLFCRDI